MIVRLNRYELLHAAIAGCERQVMALQKGRPELHGADDRGNDWQIGIIGAIGEYAVAKALNMYWLPVSNLPLDQLPGDVGPYQVRSTRHATGRLIIHDSDRMDSPYILTIVNEPEVRLVGWCSPREARALGEWRQGKHREQWWVSQNRLHDMSSLPRALEPTF